MLTTIDRVRMAEARRMERKMQRQNHVCYDCSQVERLKAELEKVKLELAAYRKREQEELEALVRWSDARMVEQQKSKHYCMECLHAYFVQPDLGYYCKLYLEFTDGYCERKVIL